MPRAEPGFPADRAPRRESFPREIRLTQSTRFRAAFGCGERKKTKYFLAVVKRNGLEHPCLGLAVSKRKAPLAVQRNRIKRLIRESFRKNQALLKGLDIIVLPNANAKLADSASLRASLAQLWTSLMDESDVVIQGENGKRRES